MANGYHVFDLGSNTPLAQRIARHLSRDLSPITIKSFSDGEQWLSFDANIRKRDVFLIQSTNQPDGNLMRLLIAADAARRASASDITAVIPYFGYGRQERKTEGRSPITTAMIMSLLASVGVKRIITMDLHANAIEGQFFGPVDHLWSRTLLLRYAERLYKEDSEIVVVTPDAGGATRAQGFCVRITTPATLAIFHKWREVPGTVSGMQLVGEVAGKRCLLVDDLADSCGTLRTAADKLMEAGAATVDAMVTHPVLSGQWRENIIGSPIRNFVVTDTIDRDRRNWPKNMVAVSMASFFAESIECVYSGASISELFDNPDRMELEVV